MTVQDVIALLEENQDARGIAHWERLGADCELRSYGIGLTKLRKFGKQIGRDHDLAQALWASDIYDARILALVIDDPKQVTREQVEQQVEQLAGGHLAHVFSSCDATLAKVPFVKELADDWMASEDPVRRGCGYGLLYEISKSKKKSAPDENYFLERIAHIEAAFDDEIQSVRASMAGALMGIGKRTVALNAQALKLARAIGPVPFDSDCEPFDVVKHLTSDYLKQKLGL